MNPFDMAAFTVLVIGLVVVVRSVVNALVARKANASPQNDARLAQLEDRVKALEAVVGDSSFELKQKLRELEK